MVGVSHLFSVLLWMSLFPHACDIVSPCLTLKPLTSLSLPPSLSITPYEQQEHTDTLRRLRFTLEFARCMVEVAGSRGGEREPERERGAELTDPSSSASPCSSLLQQQSMVADQISSLSREWR